MPVLFDGTTLIYFAKESTVGGRIHCINTKSSQHAKPNLARSNNCRLRINQELGKQLDQASDLLAAGNVDGARRLIHKIDTRYGGLAAPRSADLAARLVGAD
jgi:hypothetical protein